MQQHALLAMTLQEQLIISDEDDSDGDEEAEEGGACGGIGDEVFDDGELHVVRAQRLTN